MLSLCLTIRCTISHFHDLCVLLVLGQASWLYNGGTYQFIAATGGHSVHLGVVSLLHFSGPYRFADWI